MSDIDFQNGFLCGMATKGLIRSGDFYRPKVWNDSGVYNYFYIDFGRAMEPFSVGMFNESIIVFDSVQISVGQVDYVSVGVYKIWADISSKYHGITVLNKATSRMKFNNSQKLPVFSVHFFVSGITQYDDLCYQYDYTEFWTEPTAQETPSVLFPDTADISEIHDSLYNAKSKITVASTVTESPSVVLI